MIVRSYARGIVSLARVLVVPGALLLAVAAPMRAGEFARRDFGALGSLEVPADWEVRTEGGERVVITAPDSSGGVLLRTVAGDAGPRALLLKRAGELGLPLVARPVDGEWLREAGVEAGWFAHGTVVRPDTGESGTVEHVSAAVESDSLKAGSVMAPWDSTENAPPPARYRMVVVYRRGGRAILLEGWHDALPEGAMLLHNVQRSWSFK